MTNSPMGLYKIKMLFFINEMFHYFQFFFPMIIKFSLKRKADN